MDSTPDTQQLKESAMLSARKAAKILDCAPDYIGKLCREGKLKGEIRDSVWHVDPASITTYQKAREEAKTLRSKELATQRRAQMRTARLAAKGMFGRFLLQANEHRTLTLASVAAGVALFVATGFTFAMAGYFVPSAQTAALAHIDSPFFDSAIPNVNFANLMGGISNFFADLFAPKSSTPQIAQQQNFPASAQNTPIATTSTPLVRPQSSTFVTNTYPVIERTIEHTTTNTVSGVTQDYLDEQLNAIRSEIASISSGPSGPVIPYAPMTRIDKLSNTAISGGTITDASISGGSISNVSLSTGDLSGVVSTANGGTGTSSAPTYGKLLVGNSAGGYDLLATSSLGIGLSANAGGANTQVQYNSSGALAGSSAFTFDSTSNTLTVTNFTGTNATTTNATTTNFSTTNASTTNLTISALGGSAGQCLTANSSGTITTTTCGTGGSSFAYPFPNNATSTTLTFGGGLLTGTTTVGTLTATSTIKFTNYTGGALAADANGQLYTFATSTWTFASSTLLSDSNTFGGNDTFTNAPKLGSLSGLLGSNNGTLYQIATSTNFVTALSAGSGIALSGPTGSITVTDTIGYPFPSNATTTQLAFNGGLTATGATTTNLSATNASTTNLVVSSAGGSGTRCLQVDAQGNVSANASACGTGSSSFGYLFPNNATSTTLTFGGGLLTGTTTIGTLTATSSASLASTTLSGSTLLANATTTNFAITGVTSALLKTLSDGAIVAAVAGTDYATPATVASAYPFQLTGNATSTLTQFNGGLTAFASSTIGNGTQTGGLTISGGATTTGNAYFGGTVKINGTLTSDVASCTGSQALQTDSSGSVVCGTLSTSGASSGGGWTTDNIGDVTLSTTTDRVAVGATSTPYAKLSIVSGAAATTTLALVPASAQTANIIDFYAPGGGVNSVFTANDWLGIGTTSPAAALSVGGNGYVTGGLGVGLLNTTSGTLQTSGNTTVGGTLTVNGASTSTFSGNVLVSGNIVPSADNTYTLGLASTTWKSVYIGPGSLFVNGEEVVHTDVGQNVIVSASAGENLELYGSGSTNIIINPSGTGNIQLQGPTQITGGKAITTSDGSAVPFTDGLSAGNLELTGNVLQASNLNGGISITPNGNGGTYFTNGNVGIGNTNPSQKLDVQGEAAAQYFTATSSTNTNTFPLLTATTATTTNLAVTGLTSTLLKTNSLGQLVAAVAGTDYLTSSTTFGYPFPGNATSTLLNFTGGLTALASSTIGNGTQTGGLTISGGATTTGNAYFAADVGIGAMTPSAQLTVQNTGATSSPTLVLNDPLGNDSLEIRAGTSTLANVFIGLSVGAADTSGNYNVANGYQALQSNTSGTGNIANGYHALNKNTYGTYNVANGYAALAANTGGGYNIADGVQALYSNTTGSSNIANGEDALFENTTGSYNLANSYQALYLNTTGSYNIADSFQALQNNTSGNYNLANGYQALDSNTTGSYNLATGYKALNHNTTGYFNIVEGYLAGQTNTIGTSTTLIGAFADASANNLSTSTALGAGALVGESNAITLGGLGANSAYVGVGTTSPFARFAIQANPTDITNNTMLFAIGSSTASATTTLFSISNTGSTTLYQLNSSLLKTDANGTIVAAVAGTDYLTSADIFGYPFPGNATSTSIAFNGGLTATGASLSSTTLTGNFVFATATGTSATTTSLFSTVGRFTTASTTNFTLSSVSSCSSTQALTTDASGNVVCGTLASGVSLSAANTWTALQTFAAGASTTELSVFNRAYFGATATTTIDSTGAITVASNNTNTFPYASSTVVTVSGALYTPITSALLKTDSSGKLVAAVAGTDYDTFAWPFTPTNNFGTSTDSTSTPVWFTDGLQASSTSYLAAADFSGAITSTATGANTFPYASTTALTVSGNFYGASLSTCNTTADKLLWANGTFSCGTDQTGSGSNDTNWTYFNGSGVRVSTSSNQVLIGGTSTSTLSQLEVHGGATFDNATTTALSVSGIASFPGTVGIGTTTPSAQLSIAGGDVLQAASGAPTLATTVATTSTTHSFASVVSGRYLYSADYEAGLRIIDISDPKNPSVAGSYNTSMTHARAVAVAGKYAYVGDDTAGLVILDVSNPSAPKLVGTYSGIDAHNVALSGRYIFVATNLGGTVDIIDVSDPTSPRLVDAFQPNSFSQPYTVVVQGKYAYIGDYGTSRIYIVDISNPAAPTTMGSYLGNSPTDLYISGKYLYVADNGSGLYILNISNPASPSKVGSYNSTGQYYGVRVAGSYAYVADHAGNLTVVDVHSPASPALVGSLSIGDTPYGVAVSGKYAYVADNGLSEKVVDINGAQLPAADIGSIESNTANISDNLTVGGDINAGGGLDVGISGIFSRGTIAAYVASSTQVNPTVASFIGGNVGIGTTSPFANLSVAGNAFITGGATSTNLAITGISSSLLKTLSDGAIVAAVAGTDYATPSTVASAYPFQLTGNATSTLTQFNGGLTAFASSTIGNGNQNGGLTISGGATTTGNAYFASDVGIDTSNPFYPLHVHVATNANWGVANDSGKPQLLAFNDSNAYTTGEINAAPLLLNGTGGANVGVGTTNAWTTLTIGGSLFASASSTIGNGTQTGGLTISGGATTTGNAYFAGDIGIGTSNPFYPLHVHAAANANWGVANSSGVPEFLAFSDSNTYTKGIIDASTLLLNTGSSGNVGIGTTSPGALLSVGGNVYISGGATSTNLAITGISPSLLKTLSDGAIVAAVAGTDYATPATVASAYPFQLTGNATSTLTQFNGGLTAFASSTIGNGTQTGGLTISGGATTTGNMFASGFYNTSGTTGGYKIDGNLILQASSSISSTLVGSGAGVNLTGYQNTAVGGGALQYATSTGQDTAVGYGALGGVFNNASTGGSNSALGLDALSVDTTGGSNSAFGALALEHNSTGSGNTAEGIDVLNKNSTGSDNTASGELALFYNLSATSTTAIGAYAGVGTTTGYHNQGGTYVGYSAGNDASTGSDYNTLLGYQSGYSVTSGYGNTLVGTNDTTNNTITSGDNNIGLGYNTFFASPTASNQLNIGNLLFGTLPATSTGFMLPTSGALGVGTSTPFAKFSIAANNGDTNTTLFAIASSTANATTTLFSISNTGQITAGGGNFSVDGSGNTSAADLYVDAFSQYSGLYVQSSGTDVATLFGSAGGNDNGQLGLYNGGTQKVNIVASGNSYFNGGNVGIGTTSPWKMLSVAGDIIGTNITATGTLSVSGLSSFTGGASTTELSVFDNAYFGATATSSFNSVGQLSLADQGQSTSTLITLGNTPFLSASSSSSVGNTFLGLQAGEDVTSGYKNSGFGYQVLSQNTAGYNNTASGYQALQKNSTGYYNTANGYQALNQNTTGYYNTAVGELALWGNTTGYYNTSSGVYSLFNNTTGGYNSGYGYSSLYSNSTGQDNTAVGESTLYANSTGNYNAAFGSDALQKNSNGSNSTGLGYSTLFYNQDATSSTAVGYFAGAGTTYYHNQGGAYLGYKAGYKASTGSDYNTFLGYQAGYSDSTGANNIAIGTNVDVSSTTANQQLNIGNVLFGTNLYNGSTVSSAPVLNGNIGIGTSTPWAKLAVSGNNGDTNTNLFLISSSTASATTTLFDVQNTGNIGIGTTSPQAPLAIDKTYTATTTFGGVEQVLNYNYDGGGTLFGNYLNITNAPSSTANTLAGSIIRVTDNTTLANTVRGLEVDANKGTNTQGENTAISGTGRTFGVRAITSGDAGGTFLPAGLFAQNTGTTQGNAIRAYTNSMTSADSIVSIQQDTSNFTGAGLLENLANGSGTFTGDFINLENNSVSKFSVGSNGQTSVGSTSPFAMLSVQANNGDTNTTLFAIGSSTANSTTTLFSISNTGALTQNGGATSTFSGGINLTAGCFSVNNTCVEGSGGGGGQLLATYATSTPGSNVSVNFNGASGSSPSFSSGVLTLPSNTSYIVVETWGAGGGGSGADGSTAGTGGTTCFSTNSTSSTCTGTNLFSATGGVGATNEIGGIGGSGIGGDVNMTGGRGDGTDAAAASSYAGYLAGGTGGAAPGGGGGGSGYYGSAGSVGASFGGGGGGGGLYGTNTSYAGGGGGGGGGYARKLVNNPSGTYYYTVGTGGAGSAAGSPTGTPYAGAAGGAGGIVISVYTTGISNGSVGSGTQGEFSFYNGTGTNLSATSSVFVAQSGDIGIGTTTPYAQLTIQNTGATSSPTLVLADPLGNTSLEIRAATSTLYDVFIGVGVGAADTSGLANTATGYKAFVSNTTGNYNTADGMLALNANTTGGWNTATGHSALYSNTTGSDNSADGNDALFYNTTGSSNTAGGYWSFFNNTTGSFNTALGYDTAQTNTVGTSTTLIGAFADASANNLSTSTAIGAGAIVGCSDCLVLGGTGQNAVDVGIGTTSPTALLSLAAASSPSFNIDFTNTNSNGALDFTQKGIMGASIFLDGSTAAAQSLQSALAFEGSGPIYFGSLTGTEFGRFDTNGDFGLSSSTPWGRLSVDTSNLTSGEPEFVIGSSTRSDLVVTQAGSVYLDTTSNPLPSDATPTLGILASTGHVGVNIKSNGTQYAENIWVPITSGSAGGIGFESGSSETTVGTIVVSTSGTAYNTTSDRRLKENIATTTLGLAQLMELPVRSFDFINDPTHATTTGFIAQELEPIFPWAVTTNGDNGIVPLSATSTPWTVDYGRITPLIVKAVQDLNNKVDQNASSSIQISDGTITLSATPTTTIAIGTSTWMIATSSATGTQAILSISAPASSTPTVSINGNFVLNGQNVSYIASTSATTTPQALVQGPFAQAASALKSAITTAYNAVQNISQLGVRQLGDAVYAGVGTFNQLFTQTLVATDITADTVTANQKLCIGQTCVTETQLQQLLSNSTSANGSANSGSASTSAATASTSTPPVISINGNNPATITVGNTYSDLGATAQDSEGRSLTVHTFVNGVAMDPVVVDTSTAGTSTVDYSATDTWGNTATSTRIVIVQAQSAMATTPNTATSTATSSTP